MNSAASSFMLGRLAEMVANGTRTSSGFKKIHFNMCAHAINEDNVENHLRTWQRRYSKTLRLRKLSAAGWDEDNCIITLDVKHFAGHILDHKFDVEFFNKPLEHYQEMDAIFGNSMTTVKEAKGSNEPFGVEDVEIEGDDVGDNGVPTTSTTSTVVVVATTTTTGEQDGSSSANRLNKKSQNY